MRMKSFYPKGNWVKRKSGIKESVESLIKWAFEKTVRKSWQNRWVSNPEFYISLIRPIKPLKIQYFQGFFLYYSLHILHYKFM